MPNFAYEVISPLGKRKKGTVVAETREKAVAQLTAQGNAIIDVHDGGLLAANISFSFGKKVGKREMAAFCHQFVSILRAGVPLITALKMMEKQSTNKYLADAVREMRMTVEKGATLANAMMKHDDIFESLFVNMVRAGEETGNIDKSFEQMAIQFEKGARLEGIVKKAFAYPIVVACLAVVVVIVMLAWIVPSFMTMFEGMDMEMPAYTMFIVACSDFILAYWYIIVAAVIVLVVLWRMFAATDKGKHILGHAAITLPIIGKLNTKTACAQFARNLQTMLGAGIKISEALLIVSKTMSSLIYREAVEQVKNQVEVGMPLGTALTKTGLFPSMIINMVSIGEESGATEDMLKTCADFYEEEVNETTAQAAATMEPLLIILMAGLCIAIIIAVFLPMISLYGGMEDI